MNLPPTLSASLPIRPDARRLHRLGGDQYDLADSDGHLIAFFANPGPEPATVIGSIAGAGWLVVAPGDAYVIGWDAARIAWRTLRMVEARVSCPDASPPEVEFPALRVSVLGDASFDVHPHTVPPLTWPAFLVEAADGTTARVPFCVVEEYLAGRLPNLNQLKTFPVRGVAS